MPQNYATQIKKFVNILMRRGKKNIANTIFNTAMALIKKKTSKNPFYILRKALANSMPLMTYIPTQKGSKVFNIPSPIKDCRSLFLGSNWIIRGARIRFGASGQQAFIYKLCDEIIDNANGTGLGALKKEEMYSIIAENRAYLFLRDKHKKQNRRRENQRSLNA